jgi:hypothetical protein
MAKPMPLVTFRRRRPVMPKSITEMNKIRIPLLNRIGASDLNWFKVPLSVVTTGKPKPYATILVCSPVMKDGLFIPATKAEQWELACRLNASPFSLEEMVLPLTRAVADQAHNSAYYEKPTRYWDADLPNFVEYSEWLKKTTMYEKYNASRLVSGYHKYWLLSLGPTAATPLAVNYGFYVDPKTYKSEQGGAYLDDTKYRLIQGLGGHHNHGHWDYSQLIQFMRNFQDGRGTQDIGRMLLVGNPAIWDEDNPNKPKTRLLPASYLPATSTSGAEAPGPAPDAGPVEVSPG